MTNNISNHGHNRTAPPPAAKKKDLPLWQLILGIGGVALIVLILLGLIIWSSCSYRPQFAKFDFRRTLPEPADIQTASLFSQAMERKYINGLGLQVTFITKAAGENDRVRTEVLLEPFRKFDEERAQERNAEIDGAKAKLEQLIAEFKAPLRYEKVIVFVDNTSNDVTLANRVTLGIDTVVRKGSGLKLTFHQITGSPSFNRAAPMEIPPHSTLGDNQKVIKSRLDEIFHAAENNSAVATSIFNALREDLSVEPAGKDTRILIFSDLHENDPNTLSFEIGPLADIERLRTELANPKSREDLKARLQTLRECPKLNGARVDVYFPPDTQRFPKMVALFPLWSEIFYEHGASAVESHY